MQTKTRTGAPRAPRQRAWRRRIRRDWCVETQRTSTEARRSSSEGAKERWAARVCTGFDADERQTHLLVALGSHTLIARRVSSRRFSRPTPSAGVCDAKEYPYAEKPAFDLGEPQPLLTPMARG
ncbi:hypothetical protein DFH07DRAFT_1065216 [Mycena maculata]|uniref:Uncharacterized protein n=1 Tax=Mycena maculata TaxID=230809 RepID=A0AAD7I497_9AGAR|nr:hypothetical protein DFH07DRAFT_1065216 [Mycena maculata]